MREKRGQAPSLQILPARAPRLPASLLGMKLLALTILAAFPAMASAPPTQVAFDDRLGIPTRLPDGKLIALHASPRPLAQMDVEGPAQPVFLRVSTDNGAAWSAPHKVFEYEAGKGSVTQQVYALVDRAGLIH